MIPVHPGPTDSPIRDVRAEDARRGRERTDDSQDHGRQPEAVPRVCAEDGKVTPNFRVFRT